MDVITTNLATQALKTHPSRGADIWLPGLDHSTSQPEKSERVRRRNVDDARLFAEFASLVVDYCEASKFDAGQRKAFFNGVLGFLYEK